MKRSCRFNWFEAKVFPAKEEKPSEKSEELAE